jgi:hypothetical protein
MAEIGEPLREIEIHPPENPVPEPWELPEPAAPVEAPEPDEVPA